MKNYLNKNLNYLQSDVTNACDELGIWAAPFGILLLDNFPIRKYQNYLDIGCGTGFPLIEIANRLGNNCKSTGIDPWEEAVKRAQAKIDTLQLDHISIIEGSAESINFPDNHFDLITSNLGINNFEDPLQVMNESYRTLKQGGTFCATTNLTGTFDEFYKLFRESLLELGFEKYLAQLDNHINHRGTEESSIKLFENSGFKIINTIKSEHSMRFYNGSAFLNHSFIIIGFIDSWRNMFEEADKELFFDNFEQKLNAYANRQGELRLTIPMLYIEARKEKGFGV
ncbi:ubiquinone/menaquinone biosynthesis C-methylase UbiE [Dysgonomonas alginatilytica]|uniref:Ubiquinone/menaquinone biosynthesis C-methylase UbiE n=1 Tax=Dysgonomonas alginatilytica TaxID=1605892 RepID=A0A2V3PQC4_9BACT|nr:class I SAM-dependent methyltransferase [Dysgonomonas alginatilytica]PXV65855.1 ubiquinone/menaquinone biosynthesis C-methylase UbiE [Dysgonomonas alginatilytica]